MYVYSRNLIPEVPALKFHQLKSCESLITMYPNPCVETLPILKEVYGVNYLVTAINHIDQLYYIKTKCKENQIDYNNVLFIESKKVIVKVQKFDKKKIISQIKDIYDKLVTQKRTLFIQASGGSLKTGIIAYCLLRMSGEQRDDALKILLMLKGETRNGFGDLRIEYAEKEIIPYLINEDII